MKIANSFVFKEPVFNYSGDFPFLWDEITVPVKYGCDYRLARELFERTLSHTLGGSSANTAFGCARLGLKSAMAARVGDDAMGRFLVETLAREGCDVSHVSVDPTRLTACVVLGIEDRDTFPLIFYRENCADMAVTEADFAEHFLAQSKALLITGTHFSTPHVHEVGTTALARARRNDVRTVFDIDYRPVLWGLTKRGDGETRFLPSDGVTAHLQSILPKIDLAIGTIEEFKGFCFRKC